MKLKSGVLVVLVMSATSAFADVRHASLRAQDGTEIAINWSTASSYESTQGIESVAATSVEIVLTSTPSGSRAVLINNCRNIDGSAFSQTYQCDLQGIHDQSICIVQNIPLSKNTESMGDTTRCDQQLAVVMKDGSWLVDPISGNHNFNFSLR
jgi:hypothetical protein